MKTLRFTSFAVAAAAAVAVSGAALAGPVTPQAHAPAATTAPAAATTGHARTHHRFHNPLARHSAPAATTATPAKK